MKRDTPPRKKSGARRNPVAKAVTRLRPHTVPDRRRKKLTRAQEREAAEDRDKGAE